MNTWALNDSLKQPAAVIHGRVPTLRTRNPFIDGMLLNFIPNIINSTVNGCHLETHKAILSTNQEPPL
ncbi:MAG: hypothetical protein JWQ71_1920 [Pedosphaera sp.]|nr:hypothetical protein [Pedosphaera sp.]